MNKRLFLSVLVIFLSFTAFGDDNTDKSEFILISGGEFKNTKSNFYGSGISVTPFYIGKYEVTQKQWIEIMGKNPSTFQGDDNLPVESVSWYDAIEYCILRSEKEGLTPYYTLDKSSKDPNNKSQYDNVKWKVTIVEGANGYRLPTEIEWEFANCGCLPDSEITEVSGNCTDIMTDVGSTLPNKLNIYDMSGNVWEWCWDWHGDIETGVKNNMRGEKTGSYKVYRGGSWYFYAGPIQLYTRNCAYPTFKDYYAGLRVVKSK